MKLLKKYPLPQAMGWFADIQWRQRLGSCKHDACSGGHASPPLRLGSLHKFMAQAATVVHRYFFNSPEIVERASDSTMKKC